MWAVLRAQERSWAAAHRPERAAAEAARRARRRAEEAAKAVETRHPLLDAAAELVPGPRPGILLRFPEELDTEDARSEAVLAMLEGRDPAAAAAAFLRHEAGWRRVSGPLLADPEVPS